MVVNDWNGLKINCEILSTVEVEYSITSFIETIERLAAVLLREREND